MTIPSRIFSSQPCLPLIFGTLLILGMWRWFSLLTDFFLIGTVPDILFPPLATIIALIYFSRANAIVSWLWRWTARLACLPLILGGVVYLLTAIVICSNFLGVLFLASEIASEEPIAHAVSPNGMLVAEVYFRAVGPYTGGNGRIFIRTHPRYFPVIERDVYAAKSYDGKDAQLAWDGDTTLLYRHGLATGTGASVQERIVIGWVQPELPYFLTIFRMGTEAKVFRATGNEPGWKLEIGDKRMIFLADNGEMRIEVPTPVAETTAEFRKYRAKTGRHDELTVTIFDRVCTDTMSGMPYPNQVAVVFEGKELNGCGGNPAALLQGAEWVVEDINGTGIIDRSRATLNFGADGRIFGKASCNNYTGGYSLTGEGLTISSNAAMTMMACAPALMQQEYLFTEILKNVQRFTLSSDGALVLHTGDKRTITARRG